LPRSKEQQCSSRISTAAHQTAPATALSHCARTSVRQTASTIVESHLDSSSLSGNQGRPQYRCWQRSEPSSLRCSTVHMHICVLQQDPRQPGAPHIAMLHAARRSAAAQHYRRVTTRRDKMQRPSQVGAPNCQLMSAASALSHCRLHVHSHSEPQMQPQPLQLFAHQKDVAMRPQTQLAKRGLASCSRHAGDLAPSIPR
jgi:hypothetical protein